MKFEMKKSLSLLAVVLISSFGCTSSDIDKEIPLSSESLVDQGVVYKSETVKVDVEKISVPKANLDSPTTDTEVSEEEVEETKVVETTTPVEQKEEVAQPTQTSSNETDSSKADIKNTQKENTADSKEEIKVIVPPPAENDSTINFVESSYTTTNAGRSSDDIAFEMAVMQAERRRGITPSKKVEQKVQSAIPVSENTTSSVLVKDDNMLVAKSSFDKKLKVKPLEKERNITFLSTIVYHSNTKADISSKDMKALKNVVKFAKEHDGIIRVVGNSSSRSKNMKEIENKIANFDLSLLRAQRIKDALVKYGFPSDKIFISAVSDTEKIVEENMPINEAINRRTEIYINY